MNSTARRFSTTLVTAAALLAITSCGSPTPTCSATATPYRVCSDEQVWECPQATQAQLDAKRAIDSACQQQADPTKCILDAKYEMFDMTLAANCRAGGEVCVDSTPPAASAASCQKP